MALRRWEKTQLAYALNWRQMFVPMTRDDVKDILLAMAHAVQSFLGAGTFNQQPHHPQSWIVFFGFSFMILVTLANYTAQVTALNIMNTNQGTITTLEQGIDRGYRFCGWGSLTSAIESNYPKLKSLYVGLANGADSFKGSLYVGAR